MNIKQVMAIVVVVLLFCSVATAANVKADEVKYEVTISVTYNAVTIEEANKIIADALERHKTACNVNVSTKKGPSNEGNLITWGSITPYIQAQ